MEELTPEQQREYDRLAAESRSVGRGRQAALGVMFSVEGGAFGAAVALGAGAFWVLGMVLGLAAVVVLAALWYAVPRDRRLQWAARSSASRPVASAAPKEPRKPYWPEG